MEIELVRDDFVPFPKVPASFICAIKLFAQHE